MIEKFCQHCGYKQISSNKFCGNCGKIPFNKVNDKSDLLKEELKDGLKYLSTTINYVAISFFLLSLIFLVEVLISSKLVPAGKDYKIIINVAILFVFAVYGVLLYLRKRFN